MADLYSNAINTFFDRAERMLPTYVGRVPSMIVGLVVMSVLLVMGMGPVLEDKAKYQDSDDATKKMRWLVMLAVLLAVCGVVYTFVQTKMYEVHNIQKNSQHMANVFWAKEYSDALRRSPIGT